MRITYLRHSGFAVETTEAVLLIDCISGYEKTGMPVVALISHAHGDHRSEDIIAMADHVIDCPAVGEEFNICGARIRTFGSTDEGVSFLIEADGRRIFHAGDLNKWHWRCENDPEWTKQAVAGFNAVMDTLPPEPLDAAMFPVDPRMGEGYDEGACEFNERMRPCIFIPMHFWDAPDAALRFAEKYDNVRALTVSGQYTDI